MAPSPTCFCPEQVSGDGDRAKEREGRETLEVSAAGWKSQLAQGLVAGSGVRIIRFPK